MGGLCAIDGLPDGLLQQFFVVYEPVLNFVFEA